MLEAFGRFHIDERIRQAGRVLVGFSGGADSSCLLLLLLPWCRENGVVLEAVHVNHGIRGEEADADERFCRERCESLGIPFHARRVDVPALARERGLGLEEAAREARYAVFEEIADAAGDCPVATAHNATDNLETVLFHMMRGTGLPGLCGIPPIRGRYVRPLLFDSSGAVRSWCAENGVPYVTDRTNLTPDRTRTDLRLNVLPALYRLFPDPESAVSRMTALLRADEDCLCALAEEHGGSRSVSRSELSALPTALSSRVLRRLAADMGDETPSEKQIAEILRLAENARGEASVSLPGGVRCEIGRQDVRFVREEALSTEKKELPPFRWPEDGDRFSNELCELIFLPGAGIRGENAPGDANAEKPENIYKLSISVSLNFDKIKGSLKVRVREPGDAYRFGGMTHRVKTLFSDRKLPLRERALLPVLEDKDGIVWIPGFPPRDGMRADQDSRALCVICRFGKDSAT